MVAVHIYYFEPTKELNKVKSLRVKNWYLNLNTLKQDFVQRFMLKDAMIHS